MLNKPLRLIVSGIATILILWNVSCTKQQGQTTSVIAQVGDAQFTQKDLQNYLPINPALNYSNQQIQNFIHRWTESELIFQEAKRQGFDQLPQVQKRIQELSRDYVVATFLERMMEREIQLAEPEIAEYYTQVSEEYVRPVDSYHLRLLLVENYREAIALRSSIISGEDFGQVALLNSLDPSKEKKGDMGWITLEQLPAQLGSQVRGLAPQSLSQPIRTDLGYYVLQVVDMRKKGEIQSLDEIRDTLIARLRARKSAEKYRQVINELRQSNQVRTDWSALEKTLTEMQP